MGMFTAGRPPERTGDLQTDFDRLYSWCCQAAAFLQRENNYQGTLKTGEGEQNAN